MRLRRKKFTSMIQGQPSVCHRMPARANVMSQISHLDENIRQLDRGDHDRLIRVSDIALGGCLADEQRARATQRLAALGEMTGGLCMISEISWG